MHMAMTVSNRSMNANHLYLLQIALELGSYIGYSAIRIARKLPLGGKLYGIDPNEMHVRIAREMIQHAGLSDKVEIIQGILETSIPVSFPDTA